MWPPYRGKHFYYIFPDFLHRKEYLLSDMRINPFVVSVKISKLYLHTVYTLVGITAIIFRKCTPGLKSFLYNKCLATFLPSSL